MINPACANTLLTWTCHYTYSRTCAFLYNSVYVTLRFNAYSRFAIYALSREWPLLHQQMSHHYINKTTLKKIPVLDHHLQSSISTHILTSSNTTFSRGEDLDKFTQWVHWTSLLTDPIHSPPTFWLNMTLSSHDSFFCLKILKFFLRQTFGKYLSFQCLIYHNLLRKYFSFSNNCSRSSF